MEVNPLAIFQNWFQQQLSFTKDRIPTACCLSTIGLDNFPNARFVSLKEIIDENFIVTGPLTSRKGREINENNKVALTFWWTETERQIRIQGIATPIALELADKYFYERSKDSQIVSIVSNQGQEIRNINELIDKYNHLDTLVPSTELKRPENWGGYAIRPVRIEFLQFQSTRFHNRQLFMLANDKWTEKQLQP